MSQLETRSFASLPDAECEPATTRRLEDYRLIRRILAGETELFAELFSCYERQCRNHLAARVKDTAVVDDLMQMTALKSLCRLRQFRFQSAFSTWMVAIAINEAKQHWRYESRHQRRNQAIGLEVYQTPSQEPSAVERLSRKQVKHHLEDAINRLPATYREVILLKDMEGMSLAEIAAKLSISVAAVKTRLFRARKQLLELTERHRESRVGKISWPLANEFGQHYPA